jgi:hypothetical protein
VDELSLVRAIVSAARTEDPSTETALGLVLAEVCLAHCGTAGAGRLGDWREWCCASTAVPTCRRST